MTWTDRGSTMKTPTDRSSQPVSVTADPVTWLWRSPGLGGRGSAASFTLIELLVVLIISSLLMGMAMGIWKGAHANIDSGARMLSSKLTLTRQYAITSNRYVALLLPQPKVPPPNWIEARYHAVAMRPAIVQANGSSFTFVSYVTNTEWEFLPDGVLMNNFTTAPTLTCDGVKFPNDAAPFDAGSPFDGVRCIVYRTNGSLAQTTSITDLEVGRGELSGATVTLEAIRKKTLSINWLSGGTTFQ